MSPPFPLIGYTCFLGQDLPLWDSEDSQHSCSANDDRSYLLHPFFGLEYRITLYWLIFGSKFLRGVCTAHMQQSNKSQKQYKEFCNVYTNLFFLKLLSTSSKSKKCMVKTWLEETFYSLLKKSSPSCIFPFLKYVSHLLYLLKCFTSSALISVCLICQEQSCYFHLLIIFSSP